MCLHLQLTGGVLNWVSNEYCIGPPWTSADSRNASILFVKTSCPSSRHLDLFFFSPPHWENHRRSLNFLPPCLPAACHSVSARRQNLLNDNMHNALLESGQIGSEAKGAHGTRLLLDACGNTSEVESSAHWSLRYCVPPLTADCFCLAEQVGQEILSNLHSDREKIQRARERVSGQSVCLLVDWRCDSSRECIQFSDTGRMKMQLTVVCT